eukprot:TRINITY_DN14060_c0_g1_i1.p1 TRINITY_DN14060_c0_g1~~TRINITY_DN14060_c0_g1_i1.p1  ORF type:complete len:109 (-),score=21.52 TRINITY_DN14060_c0_g1_i1:121-402(-)
MSEEFYENRNYDEIHGWMVSSIEGVPSVGPDRRFTNFNQAIHCFIANHAYNVCVEKNGEEECQKHKLMALSTCPSTYTTTWNERKDSWGYGAF